MEEGEQRRGEAMGLTVKQRQAVMNELRGKYLHASKKEKLTILDGFVGLTHRIASPKNRRERVNHCIIKNHSEMVRCVAAPREVSWLVFPRSRAFA